MLELQTDFKKAKKIFSDMETKIVPNTTKLVLNQAVNSSIKEASKALKEQWKVTKSGKEKNSITFDKKGRVKGKSSPAWLAKIDFFKVKEARNKGLEELESNFKFKRPRKMAGLMAFAVGNRTPAKQRGIRMKNQRFARRKTTVFIRGKRVKLGARFIVKANNSLQIYKHLNTGKKKATLAKQKANYLDTAINEDHIELMENAAREKVYEKFEKALKHRLDKLVK